MLIQSIEWVDERVHIRVEEMDGSRETIVLYPAEALDILGWLMQQQEELLRLNAKHLQELRRKDS